MSNEERDKLMSMLAKSMGAEVKKWSSVEDAISKGISITKLVDTSSYISKEEQKKLELKSNIY